MDMKIVEQINIKSTSCWSIYIIKTINNNTFKQHVETTVLVHVFIHNGNTLIISQPSSERF